MRGRWRLFIVYGSLSVAGLFLWRASGPLLFSLGLTGVQEFLLWLSLGLFGLAAVYLAGVWITQPLEQLAAQAEEAAFAPRLFRLRVEGRDELATIAGSFEHLRREKIREEESRTGLISDVAHELRTPLAIIQGHLEAFLDGTGEVDREELLPLLEECLRTDRLVTDLQHFSLAQAGRLVLSRKWIPFGRMLEEVVSVLKLEAENREIRLELFQEVEGEVYGDPARLKQVLVNLIGNAVYHTPPEGRIQVRGEGTGDRVWVEIVDNGPGIAPEHLPYLFHRFYRVESYHNRRSGGTGLGLAIAREFTEAHEGQVTVESEQGKGTCFRMELPRFPEA